LNIGFELGGIILFSSVLTDLGIIRKALMKAEKSLRKCPLFIDPSSVLEESSA
jgi:hypothetical protein